MFIALGIGIVVLVVLWFLVANVWASSVAQHRPELHEGVQRSRYGWRCPQCGNMTAPSCKVNKCGGPLVWVQRETRIKCARCHRYLIAHPMLFQQIPRPGRACCRQCGWSGAVKEWKIS